MARVISFDVKADFGFFKKPDTNKIYLTYTIPPKPLVLGILGAVIGLKGLKEQYYERSKLPEYYEKLRNLKIGISPSRENNFPFGNIVNVYNSNNSYAYSNSNTIIREQILIKPSYKIYVHCEDQNEYFDKLVEFLKSRTTIFIPYLGKNDFPLEFGNLVEHKKIEDVPEQKGIIESIHLFNSSQEDLYASPRFFISKNPDSMSTKESIEFYENIPVDYDNNLFYVLKTARYVDKEIDFSKISLHEEGRLIKVDGKIIYLY